MNLASWNNLNNYHRDEEYIWKVVAIDYNLVLVYSISVLLGFYQSRDPPLSMGSSVNHILIVSRLLRETITIILHKDIRSSYFWFKKRVRF